MANQNRGERLPGEVLARADIRALLRACNQGPTGARNRALLVVLWRGGLRIAEALALRPVDLDAAAGLVRVRYGKGVLLAMVPPHPHGRADVLVVDVPPVWLPRFMRGAP